MIVRFLSNWEIVTYLSHLTSCTHPIYLIYTSPLPWPLF